MLKLFTTSVAALGLAGFMLGGAALPATAAPMHSTITVTTAAPYAPGWHHRHHHRRHRVKVRTCKNVWRHHHRVRVCTTQWVWRWR